MNSIKKEQKMLGEMIDINDGLKALCTKFSNLRSNIETDYKDNIVANAYKTILESTVATEIVSFLALLNVQSEQYLKCIGVSKPW